MKKKYIYKVDTEFTESQIQKIKGDLLAEKYGCTPEYVKLILRGKRQSNTKKAKGILADAKKIIEIAESNVTC